MLGSKTDTQITDPSAQHIMIARSTGKRTIYSQYFLQAIYRAVLCEKLSKSRASSILTPVFSCVDAFSISGCDKPCMGYEIGSLWICGTGVGLCECCATIGNAG
jgi:hypothetical protein